MDNIVILVNKLKIEIDTIKDKEGCIICYNYPKSNQWKKTNSLFTNFCDTCNVVLCKDCCQKIDDHKCPICHKKSDMFNICYENVEISQRFCNCKLCILMDREIESTQEINCLEIKNQELRLGLRIDDKYTRQLIKKIERRLRIEREEFQRIQRDTLIEKQRKETRRFRNKKYRQRKSLRNQSVNRLSLLGVNI